MFGSSPRSPSIVIDTFMPARSIASTSVVTLAMSRFVAVSGAGEVSARTASRSRKAARPTDSIDSNDARARLYVGVEQPAGRPRLQQHDVEGVAHDVVGLPGEVPALGHRDLDCEALDLDAVRLGPTDVRLHPAAVGHLDRQHERGEQRRGQDDLHEDQVLARGRRRDELVHATGHRRPVGGEGHADARECSPPGCHPGAQPR